MSGDVMCKEQYDFIKGVQDYMLEASNMKEDEAWDFGFRIWQFQEWLKGYIEKVQLSPETSTNGTYIRDGRLMHDLVYRGEAEAKNTDLISRQAAIDAVEKAVFKGVAKSAIESLPPVEPERPKTTETMMVDGEPVEIDPLSYEVGYTHGQTERPKGKWLKVPDRETVYACDQCGCEPYYFGDINTIKFCPNCGAKMNKGGDTE